MGEKRHIDAILDAMAGKFEIQTAVAGLGNKEVPRVLHRSISGSEKVWSTRVTIHTQTGSCMLTGRRSSPEEGGG